jgi:hypothetical protein
MDEYAPAPTIPRTSGAGLGNANRSDDDDALERLLERNVARVVETAQTVPTPNAYALKRDGLRQGV